MEHYIQAFKQFTDFEGRWTRTQYWMFFLINLLIAIAVGVVDAMLGLGVLGTLYSLIVLIPSIAAAVRRLHDSGRSGWWVLIGLIPVLGFIVLIVLLAQPSK
ncbi:DUF805 domain-containing protein [Gilvimarinus algae]|uniref:DUF805 domain-containing protein n=1 Tax=Gilvimarinus algae TaxID=3058037 RepID=A0ABT8TIQ2_9GAMM|nr:DUF805 domain-containing protein [Gilvimarinus sp. SDUM040014]MDO3383364.1 DUF805 domain-containing protein [Gilvimarinus sp. SDUM040014]